MQNSALADVKQWTPKLLTASGREVNQDKTDSYHTGEYTQIGSMVFFWLAVKTKITEDGEYARVSLPVKPRYTMCTVSISNCADLTSHRVYGAFVRPTDTDSFPNITLQAASYSDNIDDGNENTMWKNTGKIGYLKISGFYFTE